MSLKVDQKFKKGINRNPFNEKLVHRYFIETLYFGSNQQRKQLLPPEHQAKEIALLVPEDARAKGYRPDFQIYFKDEHEPIPVEIKWNSSDFVKENQTTFIRNNHGYLVVLLNDEHAGVPTVTIDPSDFQNWLARRVLTLSRDALVTKGIAIDTKQYWLVGLRGESPLINFDRMSTDSNSSFWAFKNSQFVTRQIFDLQVDDKMIFLFFNSPGDGSAMSYDKPNDPVLINGWAEVQITDPYYICLDGEQAQFFEKIRDSSGQIIPVSMRKWVHFIDFKTLNFTKFESPLSVKRGDNGNFIAQSANQGGALIPIPTRNWEELVSQILAYEKLKIGA